MARRIKCSGGKDVTLPIKDEKLLKPILPTIKVQLKALIARDLWDMNEMYKILNTQNEILQKGLESLKNGEYEKKLGE